MKERQFVSTSTAFEDPPSNGRPIREIFQEIVNHIAEIVRSEIHLATLEWRDDIAELKTAAISIVIGNVLILFAVGFLLLGLVYALSTVLAPWLAAVVVGAGIGILGTVILKVGLGKLKRPNLK